MNAADITINSLDQYNQLKKDGTLSGGGTGTISKPTSSDDNNKVTVNMNNDQLIGYNLAAGSGDGNTLIVNSGTFGKEGANNSSTKSSVYGSADGTIAHNNTVIINGGTFNQDVYGGEAKGIGNGERVKNNNVYIRGGTVKGWVAGGWLTSGDGTAIDNHVYIDNNAEVKTVYGGYSCDSTSENTVEITGAAVVSNAYGGYNTGDGVASSNEVMVSGSATVNGALYGGYSKSGETTGNKVTISGNAITTGSWVMGAYSPSNAANSNSVEISGGTVKSYIAGGYGTSANNNSVVLSGGTISTEYVYGGCALTDESNNNTITLTNTVDVSQTSLYGSNMNVENATGNTLVIDKWTSSNEKGNVINSVQNFNAITFKNLPWKTDGVALDITNAETTGELSHTTVDVENLSLSGGTTLQAGDTMTFIRSNLDTGLSLDNISVTEDPTFTQGVSAVGELDMKLDGETNNLIGEIKGIARNPQTDLIAENRAVAAAFVNQGADIAAESLDLMSDDYKYGVRTFGAVYGSRSKYDVNSDLKINGWNTIVGVGNVHRKGDANLAWGVFYENGTGNYRTENSFNDEFFRGDGSLVYNGGGAAVRYKKDSGAYYEASLRVGTLNSSMSNAVRDGEGNSYGYDSDSTYWGTHLGVGKLIQSGSGQWNVYGKYFHTEVEGDNFSIAGDEFSFDDVTSDRLRLGARYTADTDKDWSLYYGLAWEYEFNGDSNMKAGQFDAPEQSLQGSTGIAEIGTVWRSDDSPWRADINLKGYTGEREGFSGMVHLTYLF